METWREREIARDDKDRLLIKTSERRGKEMGSAREEEERRRLNEAEENPRRATDRMTGSGVTDGRWQDWFRTSQEEKSNSAPLSVRFTCHFLPGGKKRS